MADLKQSGTMPVVREVFVILVMTGTRASKYCLVRDDCLVRDVYHDYIHVKRV